MITLAEYAEAAGPAGRLMGPVQILVVGFERPTFSGEVLAELARLRDAGIVRLVDLLLVSRADDGTLETMPAPPELGADLGGLAAAFLGVPADADGETPADGPAWSLADAVPPGSVAAVALIEHLWATPLRSAIQRAGGRSLEETWLATGDVAVLEAGDRPERELTPRPGHSRQTSGSPSSMQRMLPSLSLNQAAWPIPPMLATPSFHSTPGMS